MKKRYQHPVPTMAIRALAFATLLACTGAHAESLPTHCRSGEVTYLNANMAEIHSSAKPRGGWKPEDTLYQLKKTGKLLSICADSASEPPRAIAYRYGPAGKSRWNKLQPPRVHSLSLSGAPHLTQAKRFFSSRSAPIRIA